MALPAPLRNNSAGPIPHYFIHVWILSRLVIWFQDKHSWAFLDERPEKNEPCRSGPCFGNCVIFLGTLQHDDDMRDYTKSRLSRLTYLHLESVDCTRSGNMSEKCMKTGMRLERGGSVRQRLSLLLKTNLSVFRTLKNFNGLAFCRLLTPLPLDGFRVRPVVPAKGLRFFI